MAAPLGTTTRVALTWGGILGAVVVAFFITVAALNSSVYSASGFVRGYLHALDDGDTASALRLAGVTPKADDDLLLVSEKGRIGDIQAIRDVATGEVHSVQVSYELDGATRRATFSVVKSGTFGGLFTDWQFSTAPTASVEITPRHDARFVANGVDVRAATADIATRYTVLAPAVFDLTHDTTYLTAPKSTVVAASPGTVSRATVAVAPKASFTSKVTADVTRYLRGTCLPQKVLLPSGCPFGESVDDRLTSDPAWSMTTYPPVALRATSTPGVWLVTRASGRAHLQVAVQSLYDGHDYEIDKDVAFSVEYLVTIGSDNGLTITPR